MKLIEVHTPTTIEIEHDLYLSYLDRILQQREIKEYYTDDDYDDDDDDDDEYDDIEWKKSLKERGMM